MIFPPGLYSKREKNMSWFKRAPRRNEPRRPAPAPKHSSPATERMLEESKKSAPVKQNEKDPKVL